VLRLVCVFSGALWERGWGGAFGICEGACLCSVSLWVGVVGFCWVWLVDPVLTWHGFYPFYITRRSCAPGGWGGGSGFCPAA